jgi:hypothetical protein
MKPSTLGRSPKASIGSLRTKLRSSLRNSADQAGHRRLRFSFFTDELSEGGEQTTDDGKNVSVLCRPFSVLWIGLVAQLVRARA